MSLPLPGSRAWMTPTRREAQRVQDIAARREAERRERAEAAARALDTETPKGDLARVPRSNPSPARAAAVAPRRGEAGAGEAIPAAPDGLPEDRWRALTSAQRAAFVEASAIGRAEAVRRRDRRRRTR